MPAAPWAPSAGCRTWKSLPISCAAASWRFSRNGWCVGYATARHRPTAPICGSAFRSPRCAWRAVAPSAAAQATAAELHWPRCFRCSTTTWPGPFCHAAIVCGWNNWPSRAAWFRSCAERVQRSRRGSPLRPRSAACLASASKERPASFNLLEWGTRTLAVPPCQEGEYLLHRITTLLKTAAVLAIVVAAYSPSISAEPARPPNVVIILADDLGYSDLGCYGGEIDTPNLDALAAGGLRFTQFYNTARCWPTRAAALTRAYAQQVRRDTLPGILSGGRGVRPLWAPLLPELLKPHGYRSYHSGKWHIDGMPLASGFDRSYYLQDQGRFFSPRVHYEDDQKLPPVAPKSGYYATTAIADHAVKCLREHGEKYAERPFFSYVAFTSPHFPLQALPADIERYRDRYRQGWEVVR